MSQIQLQKITYQSGDTTLESVLVYDASQTQVLPGLIMAPNWMGVTDQAIKLVEPVVAQGYVVLVADIYGQGQRPTNAEEATALMLKVKNTSDEVDHLTRALEILKSQQYTAVDPDNSAAFGFCFGGHNVLELARSGAEIRAAISFHGTLDTCGDYNAADIKASILVLDGAQDPLVPREQLAEFVTEMTQAPVDWQLTSYHQAVHSFTDPQASNPGVSAYHPQVAKQAFQAMFDLLKRVL